MQLRSSLFELNAVSQRMWENEEEPPIYRASEICIFSKDYLNDENSRVYYAAQKWTNHFKTFKANSILSADFWHIISPAPWIPPLFPPMKDPRSWWSMASTGRVASIAGRRSKVENRECGWGSEVVNGKSFDRGWGRLLSVRYQLSIIERLLLKWMTNNK